MRLKDMLASLQDERAALLAKSAPQRKKRDELLAKLQPLEDELRTVNAKIKDIHGNKLFELDNEIGAVQRGLGAKTLSARSDAKK